MSRLSRIVVKLKRCTYPQARVIEKVIKRLGMAQNTEIIQDGMTITGDYIPDMPNTEANMDSLFSIPQVSAVMFRVREMEGPSSKTTGMPAKLRDHLLTELAEGLEKIDHNTRIGCIEVRFLMHTEGEVMSFELPKALSALVSGTYIYEEGELTNAVGVEVGTT